MYETRNHPLLPRKEFYWRVAGHIGVAAVLIGVSLVIGMVGYMVTEHMSALDAFLNVSMLLGGMGPVNQLATVAGKLFASIFALYAGLVFVACGTLVLAPVLHRLLHHFPISEKT